MSLNKIEKTAFSFSGIAIGVGIAGVVTSISLIATSIFLQSPPIPIDFSSLKICMFTMTGFQGLAALGALALAATLLFTRVYKKSLEGKNVKKEVKEEVKEEAKLEKALNEWNPKTETELALEARIRILEAFKKQSSILNLSNLYLNSLPPEIGNLSSLKELHLDNNQLISLPPEIGKLSSLKELHLDNNQLISLPLEIGKLSSLENLYLKKNQLISLPPKIGKLSSLKELHLDNNQLISLPSEFGNLSSLEWLSLHDNQLTSLPPEFGNLSSLRTLYLGNNQLTSLPSEFGKLSSLELLSLHDNQLTFLPPEFGNLFSLEWLELSNNQELNSLPLSLGNIRGLTALDYSATAIPEDLVNTILRQCQLLRADEAANVLPEKIKSWYKAAQVEEQLDISDLTREQKVVLNEWLVRLEKTSDFGKRQRDFAQLVLKILEEGLPKPDFKELFFIQAKSNIAHCGDRASMALNEIFTCWYIHTQIPSIDDKKEKLRAFIGVAKTAVFRKALAKQIAKQGRNESESVEIYLYYENHWKEKFGLFSASQNMLHSGIGNRDWVDKNEKEIENTVLEGISKELCGMPSFITWFFELAPEQKASWEKIETDAQEEVARLNEKLGLLKNLQEGPSDKKRKLESDTSLSTDAEKLKNEQLELEFSMAEVAAEIQKKHAELLDAWIKEILSHESC